MIGLCLRDRRGVAEQVNRLTTFPGILKIRELILLDERNDVLCDKAIVRFIQKHHYLAGL